MAVAERIILGSGYIHLQTFTKGQIIPNPEEFCTDENKYAYISGGAQLEYSPEYYEAKDDMGKVAKSVMTNEEATLKCGLMTFTGNTLEKLCDTARTTERTNAVTGKTYREVKVGGAANQTGAKYVICLHHIDAVDGDIYLMIVGQNQAGFTLSFKKDEATVVDAEFKAMPNLDSEGTLIVYDEELKSVVTTYKINQTLVHVTSSVTATEIAAGQNFVATLTADDGYTIGTPTVVVGGEVDSEAWDSENGKVTISNVAGDISITAVATE